MTNTTTAFITVCAVYEEILGWCASGRCSATQAYASDRARIWPALDAVELEAGVELALYRDDAISAVTCYARLMKLATQAERLAMAATSSACEACY